MEEEDISRLTEEKFNLSEVQTAIANNELVEVNENDLPVDVVSPTFKFRGNWDASNNQLPDYRRIGDSYKVSGAGTVNGIALEVGQRVVFPTSIDVFEVLGSGGGGATTFVELTDTPDAYTGQAGKLVAVNQTEDGVEFIADAPSGATTFVELTDTPAAYTGQAGKLVAVNQTEDGVEFIAGGGGSGVPIEDWNVTPSFTPLAVVDSQYATYDSNTNTLTADWTGLAPGGLGMSVIKTNITAANLINDSGLYISFELTESPSQPVQAYVVGLAPASATASDIATSLSNVFASNPVTPPFFLAFGGNFGSLTPGGAFTGSVETDSQPEGNTPSRGIGQNTTNVDITTMAAGDIVGAYLTKLSGVPNSLNISGYFIDAGTSGYDLSEMDTVFDNPVFPTDMVLFYALATQDLGSGYVAMSLKTTLEATPGLTVTGTGYESNGGTQGTWDEAFPYTFNGPIAYTQATFPLDVAVNKLYRAIVDVGYSGPTPAPYGVSLVNDDVVVVDNIGVGTEEIRKVPIGGVKFTELSDAPSSYAGNQRKLVAVNSAGTALEFIGGSEASSVYDFSSTLVTTPASVIDGFTYGEMTSTKGANAGEVSVVSGVIGISVHSGICGGFSPYIANNTTAYWMKVPKQPSSGAPAMTGIIFVNKGARLEDAMYCVSSAPMLGNRTFIHGTVTNSLVVCTYEDGGTPFVIEGERGIVHSEIPITLSAGSDVYIGFQLAGLEGYDGTLWVTSNTSVADYSGTVFPGWMASENFEVYYFSVLIGTSTDTVSFSDSTITLGGGTNSGVVIRTAPYPYVQKGVRLISDSDFYLSETTYSQTGTKIKKISEGDLIECTSASPEDYAVFSQTHNVPEVITLDDIAVSSGFVNGWVNEYTDISYDPQTGRVVMTISGNGAGATDPIMFDLSKLGMSPAQSTFGGSLLSKLFPANNGSTYTQVSLQHTGEITSGTYPTVGNPITAQLVFGTRG